MMDILDVIRDEHYRALCSWLGGSSTYCGRHIHSLVSPCTSDHEPVPCITANLTLTFTVQVGE